MKRNQLPGYLIIILRFIVAAGASVDLLADAVIITTPEYWEIVISENAVTAYTFGVLLSLTVLVAALGFFNRFFDNLVSEYTEMRRIVAASGFWGFPLACDMPPSWRDLGFLMAIAAAGSCLGKARIMDGTEEGTALYIFFVAFIMFAFHYAGFFDALRGGPSSGSGNSTK